MLIVPLLLCIRKDESPQSPDAVIVVPSQELVMQVAAVLSRHTEGTSVKVLAMHRSEPLRLAGAASMRHTYTR